MTTEHNLEGVDMMASYAASELLPVMVIGSEDSSAVIRLLNLYHEKMSVAPGSGHNHQPWVGGYVDHVRDCMLTATALYNAAQDVHPLPFELSSVHKVLLLHDAEKPVIYADNIVGLTHKERVEMAMDIALECGFTLTVAEGNAMMYVHGEGNDYSSKKRVMGELAAFCHVCDIMSARIWHSVGKGHRLIPSSDDNSDVDVLQPAGSMSIFSDKGNRVTPVNDLVRQAMGSKPYFTVEKTIPKKRVPSRVFLEEIPNVAFDTRFFNNY